MMGGFWAGPCLAALLCASASAATAPNIVLILADDLGWNDIDVHGSPQIATPSVRAICTEGTRLNRMYAQPVCSPTRASIMSGRHSIHTGVYSPFAQGTALRLNTSYTLLPGYLGKLGYTTHMVGKWHLGQNTRDSLPSGRGFDTYRGYWSGAEDYVTHQTTGAYDFARGTETDYTANGTFSAYTFTEEAVQIIGQYAKGEEAGGVGVKATPFFLYLAYQNIHWPLESPERYLELCSGVSDEARKQACGLTASLDEGIGNVTSALKAAGIYDNTIVIFQSDNGAPTNGNEGCQASNFPLRGGKNTLWEGGTRVPACIRGPGIQGGKVWEGKAHATDWLFTLTEAAGGAAAVPTADEGGFVYGDGMSVWQSLTALQVSPRTWVLTEAHSDNMTEHGNGLVVGDMKIVLTGATNPSDEAGWVPPPGQDPDSTPYTVKCGAPPATPSDCSKSYCLFNVTADPCEYNDISSDHPDVVADLVAKLQVFRGTAVPAVTEVGCKPLIVDGAWRPCD